MVAVSLISRRRIRSPRLPQRSLGSLHAQDLELKFLLSTPRTKSCSAKPETQHGRNPLRRCTGAPCLEPNHRKSGIALEGPGQPGHHIDTSDIAAATLREWVRQFNAEPGQG